MAVCGDIRIETVKTCQACGGTGQRRYPTPGGNWVAAACSTCDDGRGTKGSGTVPDQVRYCQLPAGHDGEHEADLPEGFFTWRR